ncbi:MAG: transposase [Clostridia bacterium]|nr:transposase [Clostridia bacterium]
MGKKLYRSSDVSKQKTETLDIDDLLALKTGDATHFDVVHKRYFSDDKLVCPACGSPKTRCSKVVKRTFKDILWGEVPEDEDITRGFQVVDLTFYRRYLRCDGCGDIVFPEPIDFGDKGCRYTNRLSDALADGTFRFSYKKVCDYYGVPASTASIGPIMRRRIQYRESLLLPFNTPEKIGIIGITFYSNSYTIVFALREDDIYCIDILPDTYEETLLTILRNFDTTKVKTVYVDPVDGMLSAASRAFPGAKLVVTDECLLRYAKDAMLNVIREDGKRFPVKFKDNVLTIPNKHITSDYERKQVDAGMKSRPRLKSAYDKHQKLMELLQGKWSYGNLVKWIHGIPDDLPEFLPLVDAVEMFEAQIRQFEDMERPPDFYPTAIQAVREAFRGMPHCIFDVLRARCFLTINHDTIEEDGQKYRLGIQKSRLVKNMNEISKNIREAREYGL